MGDLLPCSLNYNRFKVATGNPEEVTKVHKAMISNHGLVTPFLRNWKFMGLLEGSKESKFLVYLERAKAEIGDELRNVEVHHGYATYQPRPSAPPPP